MDIAFHNRIAHVIAWNIAAARSASNLRDQQRYQRNADDLTKRYMPS